MRGFARHFRWLVLLAFFPLPVQADPIALPLSSVGKINQAGLWKRSSCTGTLIAPDLVLTAAHCLKDVHTGETYKLDTLHFLPGFNKGKYLAHGRVRAVDFVAADPKVGGLTAKVLHDAAVLILTEPLDLPTAPLVEGDDTPADVIHIGYMASNPDVMTLTKPCKVYGMPTGWWASNCHAEQGSSGGPVLAISADNGAQLAGILIGINDEGLSIVLPVKAIRSLIDTARADSRKLDDAALAQPEAAPTQ